MMGWLRGRERVLFRGFGGCLFGRNEMVCAMYCEKERIGLLERKELDCLREKNWVA
jgi:hypothetical protein